jgi:hypothetical protein
MIIRAAALVGLVLLSSACGDQEAGDATRLATQFHDSVRQKDFPSACGLLSPDVRESLDNCPQALAEADLPEAAGAATAQVFGQNGIVSWPSETVFVSRFPGGWKVIAAGCEPRAGKPYDCQVSGG